jgi:predicted small secreted protein
MIRARNSVRTARPLAAIAAVASCATLLAGCGTDRAGFVSDANSACAKYQQRLDGKPLPKTTRQGIDYALNYYTDLDLAVSALRTLSLPGTEAAEIKSRWLDPAQRSVAGFMRNLQIIRKASLDGDSGTVDRQLDELRHIGSQGVDAHYLRSLGVNRCIPLFGTST